MRNANAKEKHLAIAIRLLKLTIAELEKCKAQYRIDCEASNYIRDIKQMILTDNGEDGLIPWRKRLIKEYRKGE